MSKLVFGKGFNDKTRPANVDGKNVKEYNLWLNMLKRGSSPLALASTLLGGGAKHFARLQLQRLAHVPIAAPSLPLAAVLR